VIEITFLTHIGFVKTSEVEEKKEHQTTENGCHCVQLGPAAVMVFADVAVTGGAPLFMQLRRSRAVCLM
jgi:hypothetical protein